MEFKIALILLFLIKSTYSTSTNEVYEKFEIIPDVISTGPDEILQVQYENNKLVDLGKELTPTEVKNAPKVTWQAEKSTYYTLMMVDPDAPNRTHPILGQVKHWLIGNIYETDLNKGEIITEYFGSGPPKGTGLHRYIFLVFKQLGKINYIDEPKTGAYSREHRFNFSTQKFAEKYHLGNPIAGNFFQAQWDSFVDERNTKIAEMMKN